jgi:hypothetical protein
MKLGFLELPDQVSSLTDGRFDNAPSKDYS